MKTKERHFSVSYAFFLQLIKNHVTMTNDVLWVQVFSISRGLDW